MTVPDRRRVLEKESLSHEPVAGYGKALWIAVAAGVIYLTLVFTGALRVTP